MTPIRRSSGVAAGSGRVSGAAASFRFPSPMALPYAAAAAAIAWTAAGLHFRNRFDKQSLMHQGQEDPTAPPPVQALSTTAAEQAPKELTRRVADAIARLTQAVYRQLRILLRLAEITGVASPLLVTYPIVARYGLLDQRQRLAGCGSYRLRMS